MTTNCIQHLLVIETLRVAIPKFCLYIIQSYMVCNVKGFVLTVTIIIFKYTIYNN